MLALQGQNMKEARSIDSRATKLIVRKAVPHATSLCGAPESTHRSEWLISLNRDLGPQRFMKFVDPSFMAEL